LMRPALKRAFRGVYARVDPAAMRAARDRGTPVIFCATHSGWWDGHMAFILDRQVFRRKPYVMMEERQLSRYLFFTWIGAFGVVREDARSAFESIGYIGEVLSKEPEASLWMFPQGEMRHQDERPIRIFAGAARVARELERCALVPVALRYDFGREQAPAAYARVGEPITAGRGSTISSKEQTTLLQEAITVEADRLRDDVYALNLGAYRPLLRGRGSVNKNWDRVRAFAGKLVGRGGRAG
jgi:chlorobactene lauroyltransferase